MKVIDLLNKIANGEEVPKKIGYNLHEYKYNEEAREYQRHFGELDYGLGEDVRLDIAVDKEVEIIEEDKKIEKLDNRILMQRKIEDLGTPLEEILNKINEIIDYLEENK